MMIEVLLTLEDDANADQVFTWMDLTVEHPDITEVETITYEELNDDLYSS